MSNLGKVSLVKRKFTEPVKSVPLIWECH